MRKLIRKDDNGRLTEVDAKALSREAQALKFYIENATPSEATQSSYRTKLLPLIEMALEGTLHFPVTDSPYNIKLMMEGLEPELPQAIEESYHRFVNRIQGSPALSSESVSKIGKYIPGVAEEIIDGVRYEWVIFED